MVPFGPKLNTVFASRWKALTWAAGILLTAYCSVPSLDRADTAGTEREIDRGPAPPAEPKHHNPWALDAR